jgi:hypothetical protein
MISVSKYGLNQIPCNTSTVFQEKCANNTTGYDLSIVNGQ